jgi:hypothetical protein
MLFHVTYQWVMLGNTLESSDMASPVQMRTLVPTLWVAAITDWDHTAPDLWPQGGFRSCSSSFLTVTSSLTCVLSTDYPSSFLSSSFFFFLRRNDYVIWPTGKPTHINSAALHSESISFPRINLFFLRISGLIITHVWYPYISKPSHKLDVWEEILNLYIFYQLASKLTSHSPLLLPFMSHERWVVNVATHWHLMVSCLSLKNSHQLLSSASSQGWKYQQDREAYHVSHD